MDIDPKLDLVLERILDVPRELVWKSWTTPSHLKHWFTPRPWETPHCEIDLKPGGIFRTIMKSPEGQEIDNSGCCLQVIENEILCWTDCLLPGFRPKKDGFMTVKLILEDANEVKSSTRYKAIVFHSDEEAKIHHENMGFEQGWGTVVEQLEAYIKNQMMR